jgi:Domain of unknown function (DUF4034)
MKGKFILFLIPLLLLGCSKKQSEAQPHITNQTSSGLPFEITVVETPETRGQKAINNEASQLFFTKDYDKLEALAALYRSSKERYADGAWKLQFLYESIDSINTRSERIWGQSDVVWANRRQEIQDWINAKSNSITARIAMASFLRNYAWEARGGGYANTVSDEAWRRFSERLNQAAEVLSGAKNLNEKCPFYWSSAMGIGRGLQVTRTQFNDLFNEAIQAEPDFEDYYNLRAIFLLPRWYGDEGEWEKDLAQSADRIGGEDGDMLYAQVVWGVHHYDVSGNFFQENPGISWDRVDRGFNVIEKRFPDSLAAKNERAYLAALEGDKQKARDYFIQTQGKVDLSIWREAEFTDRANWAFAP